MAISGMKSRLKKLNNKLNAVMQFIKPVFFCDSLDQAEAKEYLRKNPKGIIFTGLKELED